jgi:hypothetical protein
LFQKLSAAINASSSASRFCAPATSKKPPQVRQLGIGFGDPGFDGVEHGGEK